MLGWARKKTEDRRWLIDVPSPTQLSHASEERVASALDALIDSQIKWLAVYDARQARADTTIAALATAAIALPALILSLTKAASVNVNRTLFQIAFVIVAAMALVVGITRVWAGWRPGPTPTKFSAESKEVREAVDRWSDYEHKTPVGAADPIRVRQLALTMWRERAEDSHRLAQIKDWLSVAAATAFVIALGMSVWLVLSADFK